MLVSNMSTSGMTFVPMVVVCGSTEEKIEDNHAILTFCYFRRCELYSTVESVAFLVFPSPEKQ